MDNCFHQPLKEGYPAKNKTFFMSLWTDSPSEGIIVVVLVNEIFNSKYTRKLSLGDWRLHYGFKSEAVLSVPGIVHTPLEYWGDFKTCTKVESKYIYSCVKIGYSCIALL